MRILTLLVMLGVCATALAAEETDVVTGDPVAGAEKVSLCMVCHGPNGRAPIVPIYPRLAGQSSEYLVNALHAYRDGLRLGGMAAMMSPQAATLSDQDIGDIAAYYSQQEPCSDSKPPAQ